MESCLRDAQLMAALESMNTHPVVDRLTAQSESDMLGLLVGWFVAEPERACVLEVANDAQGFFL